MFICWSRLPILEATSSPLIVKSLKVNLSHTKGYTGPDFICSGSRICTSVVEPIYLFYLCLLKLDGAAAVVLVRKRGGGAQ